MPDTLNSHRGGNIANRLGSLLAAAVVVLCNPCAGAAGHEADGLPRVEIDGRAGGITKLDMPRGALSFDGKSGGFLLREASGKKVIALPAGTIQKTSGGIGGISFTSEKTGDIRLKVEFIPKAGFILVCGELENMDGKDRGVILDYRIPMAGKGTFSGYELDRNVAHGAGMKEHESSLYPVAAICNEAGGAAMAIPPMAPRFFGMTGDAGGLAIRFYLGVTTRTKKFPGRASFSFIIYPVDKAWGFRDAMSQYYRFFPEYYTRRTKAGQLIFNLLGSDEWPNMQDYAFDRVGLGRSAEKGMQRNKKHGILNLANINAGVVEIGGLPGKPANEEEMMQIYREQYESTDEEHEMGGPTPGFAELVRSSACKRADGAYAINARFSHVGNGITFKTNPNPDLHGDKMTSQGKKWLLDMDNWIKKHPLLDGAFVDSLGANWPAVLNYNDAHFECARHPLTFDPKGRIALANSISHYEFLDELRTMLRATGRCITGNGVYGYLSSHQLPEHPREGRVWLDRFFIASLLDMATSEGGIRSGLPRILNARLNMGPKIYCLLNREWVHQTEKEMRDWFNRTLVYGVIANNTWFYNPPSKGKSYYPEIYERDKELIAWYMPRAVLLAEAGWEPVTHAAITGARDVLLERFGSGAKIYFSVMNQGKEPLECTLQIDLRALGLEQDNCTIKETSGQAVAENKGGGGIHLKLAPSRTAIISIETAQQTK